MNSFDRVGQHFTAASLEKANQIYHQTVMMSHTYLKLTITNLTFALPLLSFTNSTPLTSFLNFPQINPIQYLIPKLKYFSSNYSHYHSKTVFGKTKTFIKHILNGSDLSM